MAIKILMTLEGSEEVKKYIKEGGRLTAETLKAMDNPAAVRLLAEAMGRGAISSEQFIAEVGKAPIPIDKLLQALAKFGPQADSEPRFGAFYRRSGPGLHQA